MKLSYIDPALRCDQCGAIRRDPDEPGAKEAGWIVDTTAEPHVHVCPKCAELTRLRAA